MKHFFLWLLFFLSTNSYGLFVKDDTLSIEGTVVYDQKIFTGDFLYTIKNNGGKDLEKWVVIINPSVNILSIRQNDKEAQVNIQHGLDYRALIISLPDPIPVNQRGKIFIRFSLNQQDKNPRFQITSNNVFLDARTFWFPYPNKDHQADIKLNIHTPLSLYSALGGRLKNEVIILDKRLATWENELENLSPNLSLIMSPKKRNRKEFLSVYMDNSSITEQLYTELAPYWGKIHQKHKYFPLNEIHIIPTKIDQQKIFADQQADGEFLGNIFLINSSLIENFLQGNQDAKQRLIETIIHEIYHSYFPGLIQHNKEDYLFVESLVQYLTWQLIQETSPEWGRNIFQRTKFLLMNFILNPDNDTLSEYLYGTALLYIGLNDSSFDSFEFSDMLVEKYRFVTISRSDIENTINLFVPPISGQKTLNTENFTSNMLYNSSLSIENTNITVNITNNRRRMTEISVPTTLVEFAHQFPSLWKGKIIYVSDNTTNIINIEIPPNKIWSTNIIGKIDTIWSESSLDLLEKDSRDNFYTKFNLGQKIINHINETSSEIALNIEPNIKEKFSDWRQKGMKFLWNSTKWHQNNFFIEAFIIHDNKRHAFILISGTETNQSYHINNIISPE